MATTLMLWSSFCKEMVEEDHHHSPDLEVKPRIAKPKPKKSGKSTAPAVKKEPQRGLGVAQLERLRIQERWRKMTEIEPNENQSQNLQLQHAFPFLDPQTGAPYARYGTFSCNEAQASSEIGGFPRYLVGTVAGGAFTASSGVRSVVSDQYSLDRFRFGLQETRFQSGNPFYGAETARELPSNQKSPCLNDSFGVCLKKKRLHSENLGFDAKTGRSADMATDGCDFLGLNLGASRSVNGENKDFGAISRLRAPQEVEVVAVQRKGKCVAEFQLMEYEFFPPNGSSTTSSIRGSPVASDATVGEPSSAPPSSFLDLSLKLSC